jgi:hypothetical protein
MYGRMTAIVRAAIARGDEGAPTPVRQPAAATTDLLTADNLELIAAWAGTVEPNFGNMTVDPRSPILVSLAWYVRSALARRGIWRVRPIDLLAIASRRMHFG